MKTKTLINYAKEYVHEDLESYYDWGTIESNIEYLDDLDCYTVSSVDWVFYINEKGELLQANYNY